MTVYHPYFQGRFFKKILLSENKAFRQRIRKEGIINLFLLFSLLMMSCYSFNIDTTTELSDEEGVIAFGVNINEPGWAINIARKEDNKIFAGFSDLENRLYLLKLKEGDYYFNQILSASILCNFLDFRANKFSVKAGEFLYIGDLDIEVVRFNLLKPQFKCGFRDNEKYRINELKNDMTIYYNYLDQRLKYGKEILQRF